MKNFYRACKKYAFVLMMLLVMALVTQQAVVPTYAYTQEEKEAAKAWLSANGYSPDAAGAYAAYADYMNGKFGAIPGLPEPNVKPEETPAEGTTEPVQTDEDDSKDKKPKKPKKDSKKDSENGQSEGENVSQEGVTPPAEEAPETEKETESADDVKQEQAAEELKELVESTNLPEELPELTLPDPSQQEFADMIDVFAESFSADEQEEISKAKERLERQKQERAAAEKESERVTQKEHKPQRNVIIILCSVLGLAVIGLGIVILKKKERK